MKAIVTKEQITNKMVLAILIAILFIAGAAFFRMITLLALFVMIYYIFTSKEGDIIALGFLLCTMASVMKFNGSLSLLNIYFIVTIIRLLYLRKFMVTSPVVSFLIVILIITAISLAMSLFNTLYEIISFDAEMIFAILVLSSKSKLNYRRFLMAFSIGLILSSCTFLMVDYLPGIRELVLSTTYKLMTGERILRFSGLIGNPNHYSLALSLAIAGHMTYILSERASIVDYFFTVVFLYFGFYSISVSFILGVAVSVVIAIVYLLRKSPEKWIKYIIIGSAVLLIASYFVGSQYISILQKRIEFNDAVDMNGFTSGRLGRFEVYFEYMEAHPYIYLIGNGLFNILDVSSHNFFIEMLFYCGIPLSVILTVFWISVGRKHIKNKHKNLLNWFMLIVFFTRAMGINIVVSIIFPFYILLCTLCFDEDFSSAHQKE